MQPNAPSGRNNTDHDDEATLFLAGDVMTGRGVDQVLPHPCDPELFEGYVKSALGYVLLAEKVNGPIPRSVDFDYVWGDALAGLDHLRPDARLINLETAVTTSDDAEPKGINYRMNPKNAPVITAAGVDCCVLANNHIMDWGEAGLVETLDTLHRAGVKTAGAGRSLDEARRPAGLAVPGGRVLVFAFGSPTSGVPYAWAAGAKRAGVNFLSDLDPRAVEDIAGQVSQYKHSGDVAMASIHWGGNWGYDIPDEQREFAHRLIDKAGVDIVWGHSSHHPKAIEVHNDRLILFGCGDLLNDYEGIGGHERFRSDLALMYFPTVGLPGGLLRGVQLVPLRIRRFRLQRASEEETRWLNDMLNREGDRYGTRVEACMDNTLVLKWDDGSC